MAYITECGDPVFILYLLIDTYLLPTYNRVSLTASSYSRVNPQGGLGAKPPVGVRGAKPTENFQDFMLI